MGQQAHQARMAEAIQWHIRLRSGCAEDWDAFTLWLEGDPARSVAYDEIALADTDLTAETIPSAPYSRAANDDPAAGSAMEGQWRGRRWATAWAAIAALFLFGLFALPWLTGESNLYAIATAPGEQRIVPIGDGSSVALNGATRILLDRRDARYAQLAEGEATFTIRHDQDRPFRVVSGGHQVQDLGTVFNLVREGENFSVAVVEGAVLYDPKGKPVSLKAGQTLSVSQGGAVRTLGKDDPGRMAGWRHGQLSYSATPLAIVARDLSRSSGVDVVFDPAVAARPFTGSIRIDRSDAETVAGLAATLDLQARRSEQGWLIEPSPRARR